MFFQMVIFTLQILYQNVLNIGLPPFLLWFYSFIVLPILFYCHGQVAMLCTTQLQNGALIKQLYNILFQICGTFQNFQMKQSQRILHQVSGSKVEHSPPLTVIVIQVNEYFPLTKVNKLGDVFLSSQRGVAALVVQDDEDIQQGLHTEGLAIAVLYPSNVQITQFSQSLLRRHHNVSRASRNRRISKYREQTALIPCSLYTRYDLFC